MEGKDAHLVGIARQYYRVFRSYNISAITYVGVVAGLTSSPKPKVAESLARIDFFLEILAIERDEARLAGQILGQLKMIGKPIGSMDPFIAATAINRSLVLVTGNTDHYQRIVDLGYSFAIDNWRSS